MSDQDGPKPMPMIGTATVKQEACSGGYADSPLGTLDPSRITNMVVDQLGPNDDAFVVPEPPQQMNHQMGMQHRGGFVHGMDQQQSHSQSGTPTHIQGQMMMNHNGGMSPSMGPGGPMQGGQTQMGGPGQGGTGQFPPDYQQQQQQQFQHVPPSPGHLQAMHQQQQQQQQQQQMQGQPMGVPGGGEPSPGGMYGRPMMTQQMMQQQQMVPGGPAPSPQYPGAPGYPGNQQQQQQWAAQQQHQHQMRQAHFARQPQMMGQQAGQSVMIQRVPYPHGFPPSGAAGMPVQPAPGRPVAMARPSYPGGAQGANTTAFPYPQGQAAQQQQQQQQYQGGQQPGQAGQAGQQQMTPQQQQQQQQQMNQQQQAYQQQMFQRQQQAAAAAAAQSGHPMRNYISPQGPMAAPAMQAAYGGAPVPQPQTPQTPQAPFTPNGSRFPHSTSSPHFPPPDMRSPPLMSPNQPNQMVAAQQRPISNGLAVDMGPVVAQPLRMAMPPSTFYTHEPNMLNRVTPEMCLLGCVFHIFDSERMTTDKLDAASLSLAIKMHGGEVDFGGSKTIEHRMNVITHVIADCSRTVTANMAMQKNKRLVTLQWLCDVLLKKQLEVPSKLSHLPSFVAPEYRPHCGKLFSVSGFDESERSSIKWMIEVIGARMTPHLSRLNHLLIAKNGCCEKVDKAREWDVPVVNYQWLADQYILPPQRIEIDNPRYDLSIPSEVAPGPYVLETIELVKPMLAAWKSPIIVNMAEQYACFMNTRSKIEEEAAYFPSKRLRIQQTPPPSDEELERLESARRERGETASVRVAFCGLDDDVRIILSKKLRFLGGVEVPEVSECSHLVTPQGTRTGRLLEAIALGKNVVQPHWIIHGYESRKWMDTLDYFLHDEEMEKSLGYSCRRSVLRARNKPVFEDVTFFVTSSVDPCRSAVCHLIQLAGGKVDEERPSPQKIAHCIETDTLYIVIGCEADVRSMQYLVECGFPLYTTDLVLTCVLRQELECSPAYRVVLPQPRIQPAGGMRLPIRTEQQQQQQQQQRLRAN